MRPRFSRLALRLFLCGQISLIVAASASDATAQRSARRANVPPKTKSAPNRAAYTARTIVVDERLSTLRAAPDPASPILVRLSRGRPVAVSGIKNTADGLQYYRVQLSRNQTGWLQAEAVASNIRDGDDARLWRLIQVSEDFDRLQRGRIFLDLFPKSDLRPAVLLDFGDTAQQAAVRLTRDAGRRLDAREMAASGAPVRSYFLNYNGLDRYNRQGVVFVFNEPTKTFQYDGAAWREILARHPNSPQSNAAKQRLEQLTSTNAPTIESN